MTNAAQHPPEQNLVPLSRTEGVGQWDKCRFSGTNTGTSAGQGSLKALALKVLQRDKPRDNTGTDTCKLWDKIPVPDPALSHTEKHRLKRCFDCDHWQTIKGSCWWAGVCALSGEKVFFRTKCKLNKEISHVY